MNWTSKNQEIVKDYDEQIFIAFTYLLALFYFGIKYNIKQNVLLKRMANESQPNRTVYKPNPSRE